MVISLLYLSILHSDLNVASAALSCAEDLLRRWPPKTASELGTAISSLLTKAVGLMGSEVEATQTNGSEANSLLAQTSADHQQAEPALLTTQRRGKLVYRFLRTSEAVFR
jgi:hypothetical protein